MKKLFLSLLVAWGLATPGFAQQIPQTLVGNVAYTILPTDQRVVTTTALTASRAWTLPSAGATCVGSGPPCRANQLELFDAAGAVTTAFPIVITPASGETINGSTSAVSIVAPYSRAMLVPTSGSNWSISIQSAVGAAPGTPTVFYACGVAPNAVATGTDATAVNTETYIVEIFIPVTTTITGVAWLGLATSTGNVQFSMANASGTVITAAQTASTATAGTADWQAAAFATAWVAYGPAKYYVLMQNSGSNHYRSIVLGRCGGSKKTGETYGTFTTVTAPGPGTFTTGLVPFISTY
jgi:hypothetical protein